MLIPIVQKWKKIVTFALALVSTYGTTMDLLKRVSTGYPPPPWGEGGGG